MRFIVLADSQLGAYATFSGMNARDVAAFAERGMNVEVTPKVEGFAWDAERYEQSIEIANSIKPGFVVVVGDMIDDLNDDGQIAEQRRITAQLNADIPVKWVAGNHDAAFDGNAPTPESLARYREIFGEDRYTFTYGNVHFVVVNTSIVDHPEHVQDEYTEQMGFLEHALAAAHDEGARTILLGHHPLFLSDAAEPDTYWNLPLVRRREILELIHRFGVRIAFAGHHHRNDLAFDGEFEMVTTGPVGYPLGEDPSGYRVVEVHEADVNEPVSHHYFPLQVLS